MRFFIRSLVLCLCVSTAVASVPVDQVRKTLDLMEQAVLKRDSGAYMALVEPRDQNFATERRAWFKDLDLNPVQKFEMSIVGDPEMTADDDTEFIARIEVRWTLKGDGVDRSIQYDALFRAVSRADGDWRYAGRKWDERMAISVSHGPFYRAQVFYGSDDLGFASGVISNIRKIQQQIERELDLKLSRPLIVKTYPDMASLQYSIALGYLNPISGWNEPGESIKLLALKDVPRERVSSLLAHEIGHAVSFEFGDQILNAPWWSLEGIAELVSDPYRSSSIDSRHLSIAKQVKQGDRRTWDQLSDFKGQALNHATYVYPQGWSMVRYITQRFGKKARNKWFAEMGKGASVEEATLKVLRVSFEDLDMEWEAEMISIAQQAGAESADQP